MTDTSGSDELRSRLRLGLGAAMKARDAIAVAACRSALAAIDNAEAAELSDAPAMEQGAIASRVAGLRAGEVPRRVLSEAQVSDIVLAQVADWRSAAADYERSGHHDHAIRLQAEAEILTSLLAHRDTQV